MEEDPLRMITLRYPGSCRRCGTSLQPGDRALHDRAARAVQCLCCTTRPAVAWSVPPELPPVTDSGRAGRSARREHQHRVASDTATLRAEHRFLWRLLLRTRSTPQSTAAWATGADGEQRVATVLDAATGVGVRVLHDRLVPGTSANLDHLAVGPSGVWVVDAKNFRRAPRPGPAGSRCELLVDRFDATELVVAARRQADTVRRVLRPVAPAVPVRAVLCFVGTGVDVPFQAGGVQVCGPERARAFLSARGPLDPERVEQLHRLLAQAFPVA